MKLPVSPSRSFRTLLFGVALAALMVAAPPRAAQAQSQAPTALVRGAELQNHGRMLFTLPGTQRLTARIANGVLIIGFSEPLSLAADRIVREMPAYVSMARVDPDGRGVRFALTRTFTPNVMEAGEKVFIDLIPEGWQGLLPSLPREVVEELAQRLRAAEATARDLGRVREQAAPRPITVRAATLPTLSRLILDIPADAPVEHKRDGDMFEIGIAGAFTADAARIRGALPSGVRLESAEASATGLKLKLRVGDAPEVKTFREDDGFVVDISSRTRQASAPEGGLVDAASLAAAAAAAPSAAPPAAAIPAAAPAATAAAGPAAELPAAPGAAIRPPAAGPAAAVPGAAVPGAAVPAAVTRPPPPEPVAAAPAIEAAAPQAVKFALGKHEEGQRLDFVFPRNTAAAAFDDGGEMVIVFDTIDTIDPKELLAVAGPLLAGASAGKEGKATVLRLKLRQGGLVRLAPDGLRWSLTTGDKGIRASEPLVARRSMDERGMPTVTLPLAHVSGVHWIREAGPQSLAVATAYGPGASTPKPQRFVEFQIEQTVQGVVVRPVADDVVVRAGVGEVIITRNDGLIMSEGAAREAAPDAGGRIALAAERAVWNDARRGGTFDRMQGLTRAAAEAPRSERSAARLQLATFLLANGLAAEALGPISALLAEDPNMRNDRRAHLMRAMAQLKLGRIDAAEKTLQQPSLKDDAEAVLLQAVADAQKGRFPKAMSGFRRSGEIIEAYPEQLQALVRPEIVSAAIVLRDQTTAERELTALASLAPTWLPRDEVELFRAQLEEISGRTESAMAGYKALFGSPHRPVAARAQLRGVQLADREGDASISRDEAMARLETVALIWRGDEVEIEAIGELGQLYANQQRWREAFALARTANGSFPDHPITRKLHDETARQFEELFTTGRADQLPRLDALALFYDFKEFLPIGRRGDEIIRRLADRLVEVDLLDQAAELLQHQIDNRLNGAARATVAARLAMIKLMNNKPADALRALSSTRLPELPMDVRRARQLLEAKALSDLSRTDLAIEVLAAERGPEVDRLKADILWTARRWREAGEAHERILGEAWRGPTPLDDRQRADTMRAAVAYVMANEALSLDRLRAKYAAPMAQTPDARTFAFVTGANRTRSGDLRELARAVANADTLMEFMAEYRNRYPDLASSLRKRNAPAPAGEAGGEAPKQAETAAGAERQG